MSILASRVSSQCRRPLSSIRRARLRRLPAALAFPPRRLFRRRPLAVLSQSHPCLSPTRCFVRCPNALRRVSDPRLSDLKTVDSQERIRSPSESQERIRSPSESQERIRSPSESQERIISPSGRGSARKWRRCVRGRRRGRGGERGAPSTCCHHMRRTGRTP